MLNIRAIAKNAAETRARAEELSPYLKRLIDRGVSGSHEDALTAVNAVSASETIESAMTILRKAKAQSHLALALADLGGTRDVMETTRALTVLIEACLQDAFRWP